MRMVTASSSRARDRDGSRKRSQLAKSAKALGNAAPLPRRPSSMHCSNGSLGSTPVTRSLRPFQYQSVALSLSVTANFSPVAAHWPIRRWSTTPNALRQSDIRASTRMRSSTPGRESALSMIATPSSRGPRIHQYVASFVAIASCCASRPAWTPQVKAARTLG